MIEKDKYLAALGQNLKIARKKKFPGDTQDDFSRRLNISRATLQKMDRGDLAVSIGTYYNAAKLLGLVEGFMTLFELPLDLFELTP